MPDCSKLAEVLDNAPFDDEPLSDDDRAVLVAPIDYTGTMTLEQLRAELDADCAR